MIKHPTKKPSKNAIPKMHDLHKNHKIKSGDWWAYASNLFGGQTLTNDQLSCRKRIVSNNHLNIGFEQSHIIPKNKILDAVENALSDLKFKLENNIDYSKQPDVSKKASSQIWALQQAQKIWEQSCFSEFWSWSAAQAFARYSGYYDELDILTFLPETDILPESIIYTSPLTPEDYIGRCLPATICAMLACPGNITLSPKDNHRGRGAAAAAGIDTEITEWLEKHILINKCLYCINFIHPQSVECLIDAVNTKTKESLFRALRQVLNKSTILQRIPGDVVCEIPDATITGRSVVPGRGFYRIFWEWAEWNKKSVLVPCCGTASLIRHYCMGERI